MQFELPVFACCPNHHTCGLLETKKGPKMIEKETALLMSLFLTASHVVSAHPTREAVKSLFHVGHIEGTVKKLKTAIPRLRPTFPEMLVHGNSKNGTKPMSGIVRKIVKNTA